jgi:hypothetical protein
VVGKAAQEHPPGIFARGSTYLRPNSGDDGGDTSSSRYVSGVWYSCRGKRVFIGAGEGSE